MSCIPTPRLNFWYYHFSHFCSQRYQIKHVPIPSVPKREPSSLTLFVKCRSTRSILAQPCRYSVSLMLPSYHSSCLLQWMQSCASSRTSFSSIFGRWSANNCDVGFACHSSPKRLSWLSRSCPFCEEPMSMKVAWFRLNNSSSNFAEGFHCFNFDQKLTGLSP